MKNRKYVLWIASSVIALLNLWFLTRSFESWNSLTQSSADIIIARCVTTPDPYHLVTKDGLKVDMLGPIDSAIEIKYILKGTTHLGEMRLTSQYLPRQGENYLIF